MWRSAATGLMVLAILAGESDASFYTDDLAKCLVRSTGPDDQIAFMQWMFSAMALHPGVRQYANITPEQHAALSKRAGSLFQRLMTVDCRKETAEAFKYDGNSAIENSFKVLGEVAMRNLFNDPAVSKGMEGLNAGFDENELKKVLEEAGVSTPPAK